MLTIKTLNFPDRNLYLLFNKYNNNNKNNKNINNIKKKEVNLPKMKLQVTLFNFIYLKYFQSKFTYIITIGLILLIFIYYIINKTVIVTEVTRTLKFSAGNNSSQLTSSSNSSDILFKIFDLLMANIGDLFKPVQVSGYLDDLIGQQIAIVFILLFTSIFLILLILAYIINNLLFYNKEYIIKRFGKNNKFVSFYLKYQVFCIRFSLFYLPIFIFIGFFVLIHGLYFLITHQIPYDNLGIDLHVFIKSH